MKRVHYLAMVLFGLVVAAGLLWNAGYWDTWEDRKPQLVEELLGRMGNIPEEAKEPLAECVADMAVGLATELECPYADNEPVVPQIGKCAEEAGAGEALMLGVMGCMMEVSAQMLQPEGSQP